MTLRTRLIILLAALVASLGLSAAAIAVTQRQYLVEQLDAQLETIATPVAALPPEVLNTDAWPIDALGNFIPDIWVAHVGTEDDPAPPTPWVLNDAIVPDITSAEIAALEPGRPITVPGSQSGADVRLITVPIAGDGGTVAIGISLREVDEATSRLIWALSVGTVVITVVAGLFGWWVWRLGLRPIRRMTATAEAIAAGDESQRIGDQVAGTEAAHLAHALNTMLDERQRAEDRLRQFVADASHELRTPLTSIRGYADVLERGGFDDDPAAQADTLRRIGQESARMTALVEELLLLASLDQFRPLDLERVDLGHLIEDAADDASAASPGREVSVEVTGRLELRGDEHRLRQVLAALLHNAITHTSGGVSLIGTEAPDGRISLDVIDEGPGMPPEVAARVFERFYRADAGRTRGTGGSGLGLTIVESIVEAHGGTVRLVTDPTTGSRFHIELPANGPTGPTGRNRTSHARPA